MRRSGRSPAPLALGAALALGLAGPASAQRTREVHGTGGVDSLTVRRASPARADAPHRAPLPLVMVGTLAGGGLLAAPGLLEASRPCQEWGCDSRVAGAAAAVVGYVVGGALGAQYAATVESEKPPFSRVLLTSVFGAIAGGIVWNRIGTTFEPRDPTVVDYRSWYWGAAAGIALHLTATSLVAQRSVRLPPVIYPVPAPPIPGPQAAESRRPGPPPGALPRVGARVRECER